MTKLTYFQHLAKLQEFLAAKGWDTLLEDKTAQRNFPRIEVKLYTVIDGQDRYWPVEIAFLPELEEDLKGFSLLQCYVPVIADVPEDRDKQVSAMLTRINPKLAIGAFGLLAEHHLFFFKHNTILENTQIESSYPAINEMVFMIHYLLESFHDAFMSVVLKKKTIEEAIKAMPLAKSYL